MGYFDRRPRDDAEADLRVDAIRKRVRKLEDLIRGKAWGIRLRIRGKIYTKKYKFDSWGCFGFPAGMRMSEITNATRCIAGVGHLFEGLLGYSLRKEEDYETCFGMARRGEILQAAKASSPSEDQGDPE